MPPRNPRLDIVYEDRALLVINKPSGLLSVPLKRRADAASVVDQIEDYFRSHGKRRPFVVHRIDRDTSGLVLFAKDARTQSALKAQFRRREPEREYLAVVHGHPDPPAGTWRDRLMWDSDALVQTKTHARDPRGTEAISDYETIERFRDTALIAVRLKTGKRNQIRIQAGLRGHPLVGEKQYVFGRGEGERGGETISFDRQALHAHRLSFTHPANGRLLRFEAPPPSDLQGLIERLRSDIDGPRPSTLLGAP
jgi:23S rRNA pseudouridine1911/1915/1917 synthase